MNKPIVIGIVLFLIAFSAIVFLAKRRPPESADVSPAAAPVAAAADQPGTIQRRINVKLFFTNSDSAVLIPEERSIIYNEELISQAKEVLRELIQGPQEKLVPTIPKDTQLRDLFISKEGVAYADFSAELASAHPGGTTAEIATIYSIVDTLTLNFPEIKKVQILVNDQSVETLKGHVDLSRPLMQDLSLVRLKDAGLMAPQAQQSQGTQS